MITPETRREAEAAYKKAWPHAKDEVRGTWMEGYLAKSSETAASIAEKDATIAALKEREKMLVEALTEVHMAAGIGLVTNSALSHEYLFGKIQKVVEAALSTYSQTASVNK